MGEDVRVLEDGSVIGTFPYVSGFSGFSQVADEQEGHYIWLKLGDEYEGKLITVHNSGSGKEKTEEDREWVVRIKDKDVTVQFKDDQTPIITLSFAGATLKEKGDA